MTKLENQKVTAVYFKVFEDRKYDVKGVNLLLDSVRLYGCRADGEIIQQVEFKVSAYEGHCYICPCTLHDKYILCAKRLVHATVYNFDKSECIKLEENGDGGLSVYTY